MAKIPETVRYITVNTGNVLSLNDLTKKPNQNSTDELSDAIKITLNEWPGCEEHAQSIVVCRRHDDTVDKMSAQARQNLKIGIKLFINKVNEKGLNEAVATALTTLNLEYIDNLIISYHNHEENEDQQLENLKSIWAVVEKFVENKKVLQLGCSDIEEQTFRDLHQWATIKPNIIQINLATCCVVPPSLQEFCKDNDIQLLTHSDPSEILPSTAVSSIFKEEDLILNWVLRFFVHIKCRGVLATKGYLVSLHRH